MACQLNFHAELMEKSGVEVDVKIRYLVKIKQEKIYFKLDIYTLSKTKKINHILKALYTYISKQ